MAEDSLIVEIPLIETVTVGHEDTTISIVDTAVTVLTAGVPGPPGAPAIPPKVFTVGSAAIGSQRLVALINNVLVLADPTNSNHMGRVIGMTRSSAGAGERCTVDFMGTIVWNGDTLEDGLYFVGTSGLISPEAPSNAVFIQVVGFAIAGNVFVLSIDHSIITV